MKMINLRRCAASVAVVAFSSMIGCVDRPTIFDNPDPNLRLSSSELRGDALARFPYKQEAPKAKEGAARAQVASYSKSALAGNRAQIACRNWAGCSQVDTRRPARSAMNTA